MRCATRPDRARNMRRLAEARHGPFAARRIDIREGAPPRMGDRLDWNPFTPFID